MSKLAIVTPFFHSTSNTISYIVSDAKTSCAAIIDSVLDFDIHSATTTNVHVNTMLNYINKQSLNIKYILDTHCHADHLTALSHFKQLFPNAKTGIGSEITKTQSTFKSLLSLDFNTSGTQFDLLLKQDDILPLGSLNINVLSTPGHTLDSVSFVIGDAVFVGDTLFLEDSGTARCDFPNGDAALLYDSIQKILSLPLDTRVFLCHDYGSSGSREIKWETTIKSQLENNIHVGNKTLKEAYVSMRDKRDSTLSLPKLLMPSVQFNVQGGKEVTFLKLVLDQADKFSRKY